MDIDLRNFVEIWFAIKYGITMNVLLDVGSKGLIQIKKKSFILILAQAFFSAVLLLLIKDALSNWVFDNQFFFSNFCVTNVYEFLFESSTAYFYGKRFVQLFYYLIYMF